MEFDKQGRPTGDSVMNFRVWLSFYGISLRYDEFTEELVVSTGGVDRPMDDVALRAMLAAMNQDKLKAGKDFAFDTLNAIGNENRFDSLIADLEGLEWDGVHRLDTWLTDYLDAEDTQVNRMFGRKWMLGGVDRAYNPGCKNDYTLVFESDQGFGKQLFGVALAGGDDRFSDSLPIAGASKEIMEQSVGVWLVEDAEMSSFNGRDNGHIKAARTRRKDIARKAYGRFTSRQKRRFFTFGSTNDATYLSDPTGNRRYWPVKIGDFTVHEAAFKAVRSQLLAEAVHAFKAGEKPYIDTSFETNSVKAVQELRRHITGIEQSIREAIDVVLHDKKRDPDAGYALSLLDALRLTGKPAAQVSKTDERFASEILHNMGWTRRLVDVGNKRACSRFVNRKRGRPNYVIHAADDGTCVVAVNLDPAAALQAAPKIVPLRPSEASTRDTEAHQRALRLAVNGSQNAI